MSPLAAVAIVRKTGEREALMPGLVLTLPLRIASVRNAREHWAAKAKRTAAHRGAARLHLLSLMKRSGLGRSMLLPARVTLTRIAPRRLDDGDNLSDAFKDVRDGVADALGVNDGDIASVVFDYAQRRGRAKEYGIEISVEKRR